MNDKRLTIWINEREALPVRAIPHVAKWIRFLPNKVAEYFAREETVSPIARGRVLIDAYHLSGKTPIQVMPSEWEAVVARTEGFEAETLKQYGSDDLGEKIGYNAWRDGATAKLPEGVFVWLDDFERLFHADLKCTGLYDKPGDNKLKLAPMLDAATRAMVMEGFDMPTPMEQAAPDAGLIPVQRQQDNAILKWLRDHKHDPKKLQRGEQGKPDVKKDCRDAVLFSSASVFNTAWDRLRANGEIQDAK